MFSCVIDSHYFLPTSFVLSEETSECTSLGLPSTFRSFSGRMAKNTADCTWDFFTCTRRYGKWPDNKPCCQQRFDDCCMFVMGKKKVKQLI